MEIFFDKCENKCVKCKLILKVLSRPDPQAGFPKARYSERMGKETRIQRKARIRGPTPLQGEGAETESKPALLYFQP